MADEKRSAVLVLLLNELVDSDDEKPTRGKTREWIKTDLVSGKCLEWT